MTIVEAWVIRKPIIRSYARIKVVRCSERERSHLSTPSLRLLGLDNLGRCWSLKLCAEDSVPEAAGDTETIVEIGEVVLKVILLERLVVRWEAAQ